LERVDVAVLADHHRKGDLVATKSPQISRPAIRPVIKTAPTVLKVGHTFSIELDDGAGIARVTLVKTGSVTHSFNMDQCFLQLSFTRSGNTLTVASLKSKANATLGYYLPFVINKQKVPL
jgi:hypothetical protein